MSAVSQAHHNINQNIETLRKFQNQTYQMKNSTLPSMKASFGVDDILSLGTVEILKKQLNETIDQAEDTISRNDHFATELINDLKNYDNEIDYVGRLGDLVVIFQKRSILLATVEVFNCDDISISLDTKLEKISNIIIEVGDFISLALMFGFPEVSVGIQILMALFSDVVSFVELAQKKSKVEEMKSHLQRTYSEIQSNDGKVKQKLRDTENLFHKLANVLSELGKRWEKTPNKDDIIAEYVGMQTTFENTVREYEAVKKLLTDKSTRDALLHSLSSSIGYGNVSRQTFFLVMYAQDSLPKEQWEEFLKENLPSQPKGGLKRLIDAIEYTKTTFDIHNSKFASLHKLLKP